MLTITNEDNMLLMARYPENYFDLAIVDPPYGINAGKMTMGSGKHKFKQGKDWDNAIPNDEYFKELFRVSKRGFVCSCCGKYLVNGKRGIFAVVVANILKI